MIKSGYKKGLNNVGSINSEPSFEATTNSPLSSLSITPEEQNASTTSSKNSISVDTNDRELSEGQKEYFADSKVVDEDGKLKAANEYQRATILANNAKIADTVDFY